MASQSSSIAFFFSDGRYEDAIDAYKDLLHDHSENVALNVAVAMYVPFKNALSLQYSCNNPSFSTKN